MSRRQSPKKKVGSESAKIVRSNRPHNENERLNSCSVSGFNRGNNSGPSLCSVPFLQGTRSFRKQESIVISHQMGFAQDPLVCNASVFPTFDFSCCRIQRQSFLYPKPSYSPVLPHAMNSVFTTAHFSNRNLYSAFHRHESGVISKGTSQGNRQMTVTGAKDRKGYVESLRVWQNISQLKSPLKPGIHLTVMCYNVLAQDLIIEHPGIYRYHDQKALKWQVRWHNILSEIRQMDPDILCLQEVQESHLKDYYTTLESLGYRAIYKKKTGYKIDGCAIYYKSDKLNLVDYTTVEYFQHNVNVLNRDNIGIVARFAPRNSSTEFVVSTTHLLYNPKRQDVRLAQMQILLAEIDRMAYDKNGNYNSYVPSIITGDFNSKPDSALYKFIVNGKLHYEKLSPRSLLKTDAPTRTGKVLVPSHLRVSDHCQHADLIKLRRKHGDISRQDGLNFVRIHHSERPRKNDNRINGGDNSNLFSSGTLYHNFALKSVYSHINNNDVEGTTFQDEWITVDYIFYSGRKEGEKFQEEKLKLLSRYRLPTRTELNGVRIPNGTQGSDHLCLIGRFFLEY